MALDRGTSRQPAAAGDESGGENGEDGAVARRLRVLGSACAALLVAVLATVAAIGWSAARPGAGDLMESPPADSFLVAVGAMLLVLLASAAYGRILRRQAAAELEESVKAEEPEAREKLAAARKEPEEREELVAARKEPEEWEEEAQEKLAAEMGEPEEREEPTEGRRQRVAPAAALRAYSWATGASFGMLAMAAALGAMVASTGKAPFYGLVICIAALFSMVARWPRRSGFDLALRSDHTDAVSRAVAWRNLAQPFASHAAGRADQHASGTAAAGAAAGSGTETGLGASASKAASERASTGARDATAGSEPSGAARGEMGRRPR
jgi:hypothetical protein